EDRCACVCYLAILVAEVAHDLRVFRPICVALRVIEHADEDITAGRVNDNSSQPLLTRAGEDAARTVVQCPPQILADRAIAGDDLNGAIQLGNIKISIAPVRPWIGDEGNIDRKLKPSGKKLDLETWLLHRPGDGPSARRRGSCMEGTPGPRAPRRGRIPAAVFMANAQDVVSAVVELGSTGVRVLEN